MADISTARISGGTPAGFPDYRPFNKLSRVEQIELLKPRIPKPKLYQVWVETLDGGIIPVGPRCVLSLASEFAAAIAAQIRLGAEKVWANPTVLPVAAIIR